ncbi:hypothetical protein [Methylococcus sp. EFPC2]|uniref:hypothetical protein n=1 Tax=Methylococcus sp. EFPC2 TaxID=2812648 RepID=UPI00196858E0|nr:hypothetical protein [Methylococcus sp. EFPC2]QSA97572.1 hypothetical protein JWZ97_01630 [Methylococcus sp. EFPC2]
MKHSHAEMTLLAPFHKLIVLIKHTHPAFPRLQNMRNIAWQRVRDDEAVFGFAVEQFADPVGVNKPNAMCESGFAVSVVSDFK